MLLSSCSQLFLLLWLTLVRLLAESLELEDPELLLLVVELEVIVQPGRCAVVRKDEKHPLTYLPEELLAVTTLACRLVVVERVLDMDELRVWDILDVQPLELDRAWPLSCLLPELVVLLVVVDLGLHLGHAAEMF
jgi:hypothetical protein